MNQDELHEHVPCGHLLVRHDGLILRANRLFSNWCGRSVGDIEGTLRLREVLTAASRIYHDTSYVPLLALQGFAHEISLDLAVPEAPPLPVLLNAQVQPAQDGMEPVTSITVFNASATRRHERALLTARREAEAFSDELADRNAELQAQQERLRITLDAMADAMVSVDASGHIDLLNPAAAALLGLDVAQAVGRPFAEVVKLLWADDRQPCPCPVAMCLAQQAPQQEPRKRMLRMDDGSFCPISDSVTPIRNAQGKCTGAVWVGRDLREQQRLAERAAYALKHDMLTGLVNRQEFEQALARRAAAAQPSGQMLCYIDLDQFKVINDTLGHAAGDVLLREIAQLLRGGVRRDDLLARLGGDEFGVLFGDCTVDEALRRAQALRQRIESHCFHWEDSPHAVSASVGLAQLPDPGEQPYLALIHADIACHAAKEAGRNRVQFFAPADTLVQARRGEMHWVSKLQRALAQDRFELFFQPIIGTTADPVSLPYGEILLRLRGDDGQLVSPALFIPAAERYQLMGALDRLVLRKTIAWMQRTPLVRCAINVSGQSLGDGAFLDDVVAEIQRSGVDPRRLCFELTETAAVGNLEAAQAFISRLRSLGARFALDDFGAGLSSFSYLRTLQADLLKIDGSFVRNLDQDAQHRAIVESIHRVASAFDMRTVAEWVENEAVLDELRAIGIDYAQGWHTGRPVAAEIWSASQRVSVSA
ncbi:putative bifunctional diguanylate cyclase/phosphodiesterase [Azohydromonas aeria]|uniref:putative bifunctional diguanylate cyclase/phosphodiesterase n=1 Tax=Azohydromonas aeria TaxID=2590212 RepID=UPI0012FAA832|nr:EAL domain-containing protein [Azohydromonas aeria]